MKSTALFVLVAMITRTSTVSAGDWPQLKYDPERSGNVPEQQVETPLGLVAAVPLTDAILASPVVTSGRVLAVDAAGVLFCVDASTGDVQWKHESRGGRDNTGNTAAPAVLGDRVYLGTVAGDFHVLRVADGHPIRIVGLGEPVFGAPIVGNGRVYVVTLGSRVFAFDRDGAIQWQWDYLEDHLGWSRARWSGEAWASRGERVTWRDQFCCSRNPALHGKTLVIPAGGAIVWLEDGGERPELRHVYAPRESPSTLGLSLDATGAAYRQWYRRDNGGRVEILRLGGGKDGKLATDHVHGSGSSWNGPASMGHSSVSIRGEKVYRCRPEEGFGLCEHVQGQPARSLGGSPSVSSPVLVGKHAVYGGLDGALHVIPLDNQGESWSFRTPFGKAITAPCAVADGRVVFGGEDGYLYILSPDGKAPLPEKDLELWRPRSPLEGRLAKRSLEWFTSFGDLANTNVNRQGIRPPFKLRWIRRLLGTVKHFSVFGNGRMYTHTAEGQVIAVEQETGRLLWRTYFPGVHVSYTSPLYWKERLYLPQAGLERCILRCLDAPTGRLIWQVPFSGSPSWNRQQPPIVHEGLVFYLFSTGRYGPDRWLFEHQSTFGFPKDQKPLLRAWDSETGEEAWTVDFSEYGAGGDDAGMCLLDGTLYYSCYFGDKDPPGVTAAVEPATGKILWVNTRHAVHAGCTVSGRDGRLYLGGYNAVEDKVNRIWCLDAKDGSLVWKSDPVSRAIHVITVRDDTLFTHAQYQQSYLLDRDTGKVLETYTKGYRCTRFTVSEPYLLGANMDLYDFSQDFELVASGPALDVLLCVGAQASGGRLFFTTNGGGLQASQLWGEEAESFVAPWERRR